MNHTERTHKLVSAFQALGYIGHHSRRGKSSQPSNCDTSYIFSPPRQNRGHQFQSYRGYVHDTEDIIYLRINVPGITYGLGKNPLQLDPNHSDFAERVADFARCVQVSATAAREMHRLQCKISSMCKSTEKIICTMCVGDGTYQISSRTIECKLCGGKGALLQTTYRGTERLPDEEA